MDRSRQVAHERAIAHGDRGMLRDHYAVGAARSRIEPERHRVLFAHRRTQSRKTFESLATPLCLLAVLTRDVASDVILLVCDLLLLLLERALLRETTLGTLLNECSVATHIGRRRLTLEVENVIRHCGEECAIVTHQQHRARRALQ